MRKVGQFTGEYEFLSNFYIHPVKLDGRVWKSAEHAFQASKTDDHVERRWIRMAVTPAVAKRRGRLVTLREGWNDFRIEAMRRVLRAKFKSRELRKRLLATGDAELVEGNWWKDTFWGVCNGRGENHLGKLLMELRAQLQSRKE